VGREVHAVLDSTSLEALRRASAGETGPLWILAARQTAARGRRGRGWISPPGNLAASLLFRPGGDLGGFALRSFAAALALHDALAEVSGAAPGLRLKWPNDVLLGGCKLAGILLETATPPGGAPVLVIGIGVNLHAAPPRAQLEPGALPPTSLSAAAGRSVAPEALLDVLAPALCRWEARLAGEGFAPVRQAWLARAAGLGAPVTARLPDRVLHGAFETVDATGALILRTAAGRERIAAADLHFPTARGEVAADAARH
jgi:BirA family biotin operon repressor/biotin-[acetyl-CoA-carboxylase] ligase